MNPVSPMICETPTLTLTLACRLSRNGRIMAHSPYRQFRAALCSSCVKKLFNFKRKRFSFRCKLGWMWWRTQSSASQVVSRGPCERIRPRSMQFYSSGWAFVSGPRFELLDGPRLMRAKIAASMSTPYTHQQGWASSSASPLIFLQKKILLSSDTIHSKYQHGTNENLITRQKKIDIWKAMTTKITTI